MNWGILWDPNWFTSTCLKFKKLVAAKRIKRLFVVGLLDLNWKKVFSILLRLWMILVIVRVEDCWSRSMAILEMHRFGTWVCWPSPPSCCFSEWTHSNALAWEFQLLFVPLDFYLEKKKIGQEEQLLWLEIDGQNIGSFFFGNEGRDAYFG